MTKINFTVCKYCGKEQVNADLTCMSCGEVNLTPEQQKIWDWASENTPDVTQDYHNSYDAVKNSYYFSSGRDSYEKAKAGPTAVEKLAASFKPGMLFENAQNSKFKIKEVDDVSVIFEKLSKDGLKTDASSARKFKKTVLAQLIINKYFSMTRIARREAFMDLKSIGVFDLIKK